MLSPETAREAVRFDAIDELRWTPCAGEIVSDSRVLRRDEPASLAEVGVRPEVERCGRSVLEEFALDEPMSVNFAPCRERGGGGGDFAAERGSLLLGTGLARVASTECCEDKVKFELLRDLFSAVEVRS